MERILALILCLASLTAFAKDPTNTFSAAFAGDPSGNATQNVNAITGSFYDNEIDYDNPFYVFQRLHDSGADLDDQRWNTTPFNHIVLLQESIAQLPNCQGSWINFEGHKNKGGWRWSNRFNHKGFVNTSSGTISGQTDPRNYRVAGGQDLAHLYLGDGTHYSYHRSYCDQLWHYNNNKKTHTDQGRFVVDTIYSPNGLRFNYEFKEDVLRKITVTNFDCSITFLSCDCDFLSEKHRCKYRFSDSAYVEVTREWSKRPYLPIVHYKTDKHQHITRKEHPQNRFLEISYDHKNRVIEERAPVGSDATPIPFARFSYETGYTTYTDAYGHQKVYHYDENQTLQAIVQPENIERFSWSAGNLQSRSFHNSNNDLIVQKTFSYDARGNVLEEKTYGNIRGANVDCRQVNYSYSNNSFNQLTSESHANGKCVRYFYDVPQTSLLTRKYTSDNGRNVQREFMQYDAAVQVSYHRIDNGFSEDINSMDGATFAKIERSTYHHSGIAVGRPIETQERYWDPSCGEKTLKTHKFFYDQWGNCSKEELFDADGQFRYTTEWIYNDKRQLIQEKDPRGNITRYCYDDNFNVITKESPTTFCTYTYDYMNRCVQEELRVDGELFVTHHRYDYMSRLVATIDPHGAETLFEYDSLGHLIKTVLPQMAVITREYDLLGHISKETNPLGGVTTTTWTIDSKPIQITYPQGQQEHFEYTITGNLLKHTLPSGSYVIYSYDALDHIVSEQQFSPAGEFLCQKSATYAGVLLTSQTDPLGNTTYYDYDYAGRLIAERKGDHKTTYSYDAMGYLAATHNDTLHKYEEYDAFGNILTEKVVKDHVALLTHFTYDRFGNCTSKTIYPNNIPATTTTEYDGLFRPIKITDPLGAASTIQYIEQPLIQKIETDPLGKKTIVTSDLMGRIKTVEEHKNVLLSRTEFFYDAAGNRIRETHTVISPVAIDIITNAWEYDTGGRLLRLIEADQAITQYLYDHAGRLCQKIKPDGVSLFTTYDALGRVARNYSDGQNPCSYAYTYDAAGNILSLKNEISQATTERRYDIYGNITYEQLESGLTLSNSYDQLNRPVRLTLPDNSTIDRQYNIDIASVRYKEYTIDIDQYDLAGNVLQTHALNTTITKQYDSLNRISSIQSPHFSETNTYDAVSNLTSDGQSTFTFDDLYQITSETGPFNHNFINDSLSNRVAYDDIACELNALNQLLSDKNGSYNYSLAGNLAQDNSAIYTYDAFDRLVSIQFPEKNFTLSFSYDGFNRRISKKVYDSGNLAYALSFIYDDQCEIGSCDNTNTIVELRLLTKGLGAEIASAGLILLDDIPYVPTHDHRGCLTTLSHTDGSLAETYHYSSYGEEDLQPHTINNPWRFSSKRLDEESHLIYFGRRYYSPSLGRFLTKDPEGYHDGANLYSYVHNSPLTHIDLWGLERFREEGVSYHDHSHKNYSRRAEKSSRTTVTQVAANIVQTACSEAAKGVIAGALLDVTTFFDPVTSDAEGWLSVAEIAAGMIARSGGFVASSLGVGKLCNWGLQAGMKVYGVGKEAYYTYKATKLAKEFQLSRSSLEQVNGISSGIIPKDISTGFTPEKFFGRKTYDQLKAFLTQKFGTPRPGAPGGMSFFNPKTGRTFHLHIQEGHMEGKPHVDIRRRGPYQERKCLLKEESHD